MKQYNSLLSLQFEIRIGVKALLRVLVELVEIRDAWSLFYKVRELSEEILNEHSESSAPISHVVDSLHVVTLELEDSANGLSHDCGPQVAHVHFLGDVW